MAPADASCLFCDIVMGVVPAEVVHRGPRVWAFRDIDPQAPTHILVIPVQHYPDVVALATEDPQALADMVGVGAEVADAERSALLDSSGSAAGADESVSFRLVFNTGPEAGQSVFHAHGHVLSGRTFAWPPG